MLPMSQYFGKKPDPAKDPFDRRVTQQLNDICFEEDSEEDFEDMRAVKRQSRTVLTEENLRKYLGDETVKLNLEHHYWLKDSFLSKLGRMAPKLQRLSLRRLKITDDSFFGIAKNLEKGVLERLDISDCPFIGKKSVLRFLEQCGESCRYFQASSCYDGIDDEVLQELANPVARDEDGRPDPEGKIPTRCLQFIDISYCKQVTDAGLIAFEGKTFPLTHLCVNGLTEVTGAGLFHPIQAGKDTLEVYQGALMDQEGLANATFAKALGHCFNLQTLDLGGCRHIGDEFFNFICQGEKMEDGLIVKPGLAELVTVKLNFLTRIMDGSVARVA